MRPDHHCPRPGDVWQKNGSDRQVRVEAVDSRYVYARNTVSGRQSRMDIWTTFRSGGKTGWTRVSEGTS